MGEEQLAELIKSTIEDSISKNKLLIAVIPIFLTVGLNFVIDYFRRKKEFVKKYKIEQLRELYMPLYCMIVQSEYLRQTIGNFPGVNLSIKDTPYVHLEKKKRN